MRNSEFSLPEQGMFRRSRELSSGAPAEPEAATWPIARPGAEGDAEGVDFARRNECIRFAKMTAAGRAGVSQPRWSRRRRSDDSRPAGALWIGGQCAPSRFSREVRF